MGRAFVSVSLSCVMQYCSNRGSGTSRKRTLVILVARTDPCNQFVSGDIDMPDGKMPRDIHSCIY